jgi:acetyltransferase-like isoleucine patch superfamily enzyme
MSRFLEHDWFPEPLPDNVQLGERSWLHSTYAFRHYRSRQPQGLVVGNDSGLYKGTFFNLGPRGEVVIGNFCTIVGAIISTNARVIIRDYALIAHEVVIADQAAAIPGAGAGTDTGEVHRESIIIGANAWIATRAVLLGGARIGEGAVVGAAAVVDFEVPPYTIVAGNPARVVGHTRP